MKHRVDVQLSHLVDMSNPGAVLEEVKNNFIRCYPVTAFNSVRQTFNDFMDLYEGRYQGYRACNTRFHDKIHTTDALLAISRLIDGYMWATGRRFSARLVVIALQATILHDTGYIQSKKDTRGTGAKYTLNHVERSIDFMQAYLASRKVPAAHIQAGARMIRCTGLGTDIASISFASPQERTLGLMLGTADLIGQMASRTYLERLLYLFREFKEGHVGGFKTERELLRKTLGFYTTTRVRMNTDMQGVSSYVVEHFRRRYRINEDLYAKAVRRQIRYLKSILGQPLTAYRYQLRRVLA